jgi:hypothetical protein
MTLDIIATSFGTRATVVPKSHSAFAIAVDAETEIEIDSDIWLQIDEVPFVVSSPLNSLPLLPLPFPAPSLSPSLQLLLVLECWRFESLENFDHPVANTIFYVVIEKCTKLVDISSLPFSIDWESSGCFSSFVEGSG